MAEAFVERRIGETRAAVREGGRVVEMLVERVGDGAPAGSRLPLRLVRKLGPRGIGRAASGEEFIVEPWPTGATEGATMLCEVRRQAWREPGRDRLAKARATQGVESPAVPLTARLKAAGLAIRDSWPDDVADAFDTGWEEAELGRAAIPGGTLSFTLTPAFLAVDVDGVGVDLAAEAAAAVAARIRLWGVGGQVVIDLPTNGRAERQAAGDAVDRGLEGVPFERTAVNGFGLLQIVLPRRTPSILERARFEPVETAALALLKQAARDGRPGALRIVARPAVVEWLAAHPALLKQAARQAGKTLDLSADPLAGNGHVEIQL